MNRCLIVDDDPKILNYVSTHLKENIFIHILIPMVKKHFIFFDNHQVDIAIVDIMMHGMDGFELCHMIKEDYDLPVIMLTARDAPSDKERAFISERMII